MSKKTFELATLEVKQVSEFAGLEEKQNEILKANGFVAIKDIATYDLARQRRTTLKTARTSIEKIDKSIGSFLRNFRNEFKTQKEKFVSITAVAEEKQQVEIEKWELEKQKKKDEAIAKAEQREKKFIKTIEDVESELVEIIKTTKFANIESKQILWDKVIAECEDVDYEEFVFHLDDMLARKTIEFFEAKERAEESEVKRIEQIKSDERALLDALYRETSEWIENYNASNNENLVNTISKTFKDCKVFTIKTNEVERVELFDKMIAKATSKIKSIELEKERIEKETINEEKEDLFNFRDEIADEIENLSFEAYGYNHDTTILKRIKNKRYNLIAVTWETAAKRLVNALTIKIKELDIEQSEKQALFEDRVKQLLTFGLERMGASYNKTSYTSAVEILVDNIRNHSKEDWDATIKLIKAFDKKTAKEEKEDVARQKELKPQKAIAQKQIAKFHLNFDLSNIKAKELLNLMSEFAAGISELIEQTENKIENL